MTRAAQEAAQTGKKLTISPAAAVFLGQANAQRIQAAGPVQTPREAKQRLAALR